jgi:hypothetical protein
MTNSLVNDMERVVDIMRDILNTVDTTRWSIDTTRFTIDGDGMPPYYMYGHKMVIAKELLEKDSDKVQKYRKYPLVALRLDSPAEIDGGIIKYNLNIGLFHMTEVEYSAKERFDNVIDDVLMQMYRAFFKALKDSGKFHWPNIQDYPPHTKIDRPFWGVEQDNGNAAHIFNDPLDAIEIVDLKINSYIRTNC